MKNKFLRIVVLLPPLVIAASATKASLAQTNGGHAANDDDTIGGLGWDHHDNNDGKYTNDGSYCKW